MPYLVKKLQASGEEKSRIESVKFKCRAEAVDEVAQDKAVESELFFVEDVNRIYSKYDFSIIVKQYVKRHNETIAFLLFTSNEIYKTRNDAFVRIRNTLTPLLTSSTVILTEALLHEVIIPDPLEPHLIGSKLVNFLETDPEGNQEWHLIIQSLAKYTEVPQKTPPTIDGEVLSLKEYYESTNVRQMKLRMQRAGVLGSHILPMIAVPAVATEAATVNDTTTSKKILHFSKRGTLKRHNSTHFQKTTWLIDAVEKEYLQSSMYLALSGINPNDQHALSGDTALHIAVRLGNIHLVKLLLACNADPTITNKKHETPMDISKRLKSRDAPSICSMLQKIAILREKAEHYYTTVSVPLPDVTANNDAQFLLSLDGGGIRGMMESLILIRIEERMKQLQPNSPFIQSYFNYIAGTSSGSLLAAGLLYRNVSTPNTLVTQLEYLNEVFTVPLAERPYVTKKSFEGFVGKSTVLSDLENGNIIITTAIATVSPNKLHLMTNYGESRNGFPGPNERRLVDALMCSTAAPMFFPPFEDCFVDGGVVCNNPTIAAMVDIYNKWEKENKQSQRLGLVLSLGTGVVPPKIIENIEVFVPNYYSFSSMVTSALGLKSLFTHFMDQSLQADGPIVEEAQTWCKTTGTSYYRLSPPLTNVVPLDTVDPKELVELLFIAQVYVMENHVTIDQIAKELLTKNL